MTSPGEAWQYVSQHRIWSGVITGLITLAIIAVVGLFWTQVISPGEDDVSPTDTPRVERPIDTPDPDPDDDGILGVEDACPNERETVNEFQDQDGCSDSKPFGASLSLGDLRLPVGESGSVTLEASNIRTPGLGAWTIDVTYSRLEVSPVECEAFAGGVCNPTFGPETVRITGASGGGLEGDTALGTITFRCIKVGASALAWFGTVFADATIGGPQDISVSNTFGSVTCY